MDEPDIKLTKRGKPDKRTGADGTSRKNRSRARETMNTLVRAGRSAQYDDSSHLGIPIQKRAPVAQKRPKPIAEPKGKRAPSPNDDKYSTLLNDLVTLRQEMADLRALKPKPLAHAPNPVASLRRQMLMSF